MQLGATPVPLHQRRQLPGCPDGLFQGADGQRYPLTCPAGAQEALVCTDLHPHGMALRDS